MDTQASAMEARLFPVVETQYGKIRGLNHQGVKTFKGIRYGASTEGGLPPKKESSCNVRLELKIKGVNHGQEIAFSRADHHQATRS